uniref:Uncharacterized protein n=1 Tax=uncultured Planctomycetota bacterium TaxID=120965 RepID=H5SIJ3_9BACT|nr:hypothetical protein HGMM_F33C03C22 [uncultured Planctomycetota bacterium]
MRSLHRYIEFLGARFLWWDDKPNQPIEIDKQLLKTLSHGRVCPYFRLRSKQPGLSFAAPIEVYVICRGSAEPRLLASEEIVITDAPTVYVPGTIAASDVRQIIAFELRHAGHSIGHLSLCPVPVAKINSEGAFQAAPEDLPWSPAYDEELRERLDRLMEQP